METKNEPYELSNSHVYKLQFVYSYKEYLIQNGLDKPDNSQFRKWAQQMQKFYQTEADKADVCSAFKVHQGLDYDDVLGGKYLVQITKIENYPATKNALMDFLLTVGKTYDDDSDGNYLESE